MIEDYLDFWRRYGEFGGKSNRRQYWNWVLATFLLVFAFSIVMGVFTSFAYSAFGENAGNVVAVLMFAILIIYGIATLLPSFAIQVRRLRDGGFPWGLIFLHLLYGVGGIILLVLFIMPTQVNYYDLVQNHSQPDQNTEN